MQPVNNCNKGSYKLRGVTQQAPATGCFDKNPVNKRHGDLTDDNVYQKNEARQ
jgi:hypothetical protein